MDGLHASGKEETSQYAIFNVEDIVCCVDISAVREINRNLHITRVHRAPDCVRGVINLRGQIHALFIFIPVPGQ